MVSAPELPQFPVLPSPALPPPVPSAPRIPGHFCNAIPGAGGSLEGAQLEDRDFAKTQLKMSARQGEFGVCVWGRFPASQSTGEHSLPACGAAGMLLCRRKAERKFQKWGQSSVPSAWNSSKPPEGDRAHTSNYFPPGHPATTRVPDMPGRIF